MKQVYNKIIITLIFIVLIIVFYFSGITSYINLAVIQQNSVYLKNSIQNNYTVAVLVFICLYIVTIFFSLPFASLLTLSGGFFFGITAGVLYANIGATIGATCGFLLVRYLLYDIIRKKYAYYVQKINRAIQKNGVWYLLLLRLIAFIPFPIANAAISLTDVSLFDFVWTTSIGIVPVSLIYAYAGRQLSTLTSITDVFSMTVLLAFIFFAFLTLLPTLLKRVGYGS
ncbi:TVP38/TMEM64 family protein [Candidatus Dependentiae bacterium]|nr:TVP38/TMEM64 family protein [Candidatus Dependentiae bacterium]